MPSCFLSVFPVASPPSSPRRADEPRSGGVPAGLLRGDVWGFASGTCPGCSLRTPPAPRPVCSLLGPPPCWETHPEPSPSSRRSPGRLPSSGLGPRAVGPGDPLPTPPEVAPVPHLGLDMEPGAPGSCSSWSEPQSCTRSPCGCCLASCTAQRGARGPSPQGAPPFQGITLGV